LPIVTDSVVAVPPLTSAGLKVNVDVRPEQAFEPVNVVLRAHADGSLRVVAPMREASTKGNSTRRRDVLIASTPEPLERCP